MVFLDNFIRENKAVSDGENKLRRRESLDEYELSRKSDYALVRVKEIFAETEQGVLSVGKVLKGALVRGFKAKIGNKIAAVNGIMSRYESRDAVSEGSFVGLALAGIQKYDVRPGMTIRFVRVGKGIVE